jgi:S1-C subfamily serine protease
VRRRGGARRPVNGPQARADKRRPPRYSWSPVSIPHGGRIAKDAASHKLVRFFDVKRLGVEVAPDDAGVRVKAAPHGGCFSRGGVRPGDVVTAVAGEKVADAEALRRLLRPHAAEQASVAVTLLRDGKRVVANVPLRP